MSKQRTLLRNVVVLGFLGLMGLGADHPSLLTPDVKEANTFQRLGRLTQAWEAGEVKEITILYFPKTTHIMSPTTPKMLDSEFTYLLIIRDAGCRPICRRLMKVLEKVKTRSSEQQSDVRWALIFENQKEEKICSIYFGGSGKHAVVDGSSVEVDSDELVSWVNKTFAGIFDE